MYRSFLLSSQLTGHGGKKCPFRLFPKGVWEQIKREWNAFAVIWEQPSICEQGLFPFLWGVSAFDNVLHDATNYFSSHSMCIFYFCSCKMGFSNPLALKLQCISESAGRLVQTQPPGPCPQSFWFSESRVGLENFPFWELLGDTDAVGLGTTLWEPLLKGKGLYFLLYLPTSQRCSANAQRWNCSKYHHLCNAFFFLTNKQTCSHTLVTTATTGKLGSHLFAIPVSS